MNSLLLRIMLLVGFFWSLPADSRADDMVLVPAGEFFMGETVTARHSRTSSQHGESGSAHF